MGIPPFQAQEMIDRLERNRKRQPDEPPVESQAVERESKLHDQILDECRRRGWLAFHGSMAHRAMRTLGEPDFTILADGGRVHFIECKSKTGKLSREQMGLQMMAEKLGHQIHIVRSFQDFINVVDNRNA